MRILILVSCLITFPNCGLSQVYFLPFSGAIGFDPTPLILPFENGYSVIDTANYSLMANVDNDAAPEVFFAVEDTITGERGIYVLYGDGRSELLGAGVLTKIPIIHERDETEDYEATGISFEGWASYTPEQIKSSKKQKRGYIPSHVQMIQICFNECGLDVENDVLLIGFEDVFYALYRSAGKWYFVNLGA